MAATPTPEQFVQELARRGIQIELECAEPVPQFRLTAEPKKITEGICEYIRRNREAIYALFGQSRCYECWRLVDEHDESAWHITEDGELYCVTCWRTIFARIEDVDPTQESKDAFQSRLADLVGIFPGGCDVVFTNMNTEAYIAQFYAQHGLAVEQNDHPRNLAQPCAILGRC